MAFPATLPASVCQKAGLAIGELLEATVRGKKISFTPKSVVDREFALALDEMKKGRVYGPFSSAKEVIRSLHREARRTRKR